MSILRRAGAAGRYTAIPNLVVAQRVIDKMLAAAQRHIADETGEAMVGVLAQSVTGVNTLYVLDTISPDETAIRDTHTFQQGDERQDEIIWWLQENWHAARKKAQSGLLNRAFGGLTGFGEKWNVPLQYLGDWHKQPGHMILPSGGDLMTALDWIDDPDNDAEFLLAPIVTLGHPSTTDGGPGANFLMLPLGDGEAMRVDFWYIDATARMFAAIAPTLYPDDQLPTLAPYPWHLVDNARFEAENARLEADKLLVSLTLWDADNAPPLDVCFLTGRTGATQLLLIITPHNYPKQPPRARVAPFVAMRASDDMYSVFEAAWKASQPVKVEYAWTQDSWLIDFIHAAEDAVGIARPKVEPVAAAADGGTVHTPPPTSSPDPLPTMETLTTASVNAEMQADTLPPTSDPQPPTPNPQPPQVQP